MIHPQDEYIIPEDAWKLDEKTIAYLTALRKVAEAARRMILTPQYMGAVREQHNALSEALAELEKLNQ